MSTATTLPLKSFLVCTVLRSRTRAFVLDVQLNMSTVPTTIHTPQLCLGMQKEDEEEVACFHMALGMRRVAKCTMNKQAMHPTSCSPPSTIYEKCSVCKTLLDYNILLLE